jgi:hypothetical protein
MNILDPHPLDIVIWDISITAIAFAGISNCSRYLHKRSLYNYSFMWHIIDQRIISSSNFINTLARKDNVLTEAPVYGTRIKHKQGFHCKFRNNSI